MEWKCFLAPIHDYSDLAFRLLCQRYGAEATCAPLVSATAIARDRTKLSLIDAHPAERNLGVQLVGDDPAAMGKAAAAISEALPFVSWLNINCGCPSARTRECGGGSALLESPGKIVDAVRAVKRAAAKNGMPVSVKLRLKDGTEGTASICKLIEGAGADFVIVHGRSVAQGYSGKADWEAIKSLKGRLGIPVIGNGDLKDAGEGGRLVADGYCDGFMIGRAAMANPMVFRNSRPANAGERFALLREYAALQEGYLGRQDLLAIKMKALNFMRGLPAAASMRDRISRARAPEQVFEEETEKKSKT